MIFFGKKENTIEKTRLCNGHEVDFTYKFRKRRSIEIRVDRSGKVIVSAPLKASMKKVEEFVASKEDWIISTVEKHKNNVVLKLPNKIESGERFYFLGRELVIEVIRNIKSSVTVDDKKLIITSPYIYDYKLLQQIFDKWLREVVDKVFAERLQKVLPYAEAHNIAFNDDIQARKMKSRYGTCTGDNRIFLNSSLVMVDEELIDYVIAHELCHIREKNHSPRFYRLLGQLMPDWKIRRTELHRVVFG